MKIGGILNARSVNKTKIKLLKKTLKPTRAKVKKILLYGFGGFVLLVVLMFAWFAKDLPTQANLSKIHSVESTKILDRNGNVLYQTGQEKRTIIDKKDIPQVIKDATIAAEDANFYNHHGLDFKGVTRAAVSDVLHLNLSQGGSTITQQFVKNALLTNKKSFARKIKELILSIEIEQMYSKDEILALYLNEIPYGGNIYGIEEASKAFFGKSAKDLSLSEAATLAGVPRAPTYYSPYGTHTDRLFARKDYILDRIAQFGYASETDTNKAKTESPTKEKPEFKQKRESITAPHFVMYVKQKLVDMYGEKMVDGGGLKVTTSLDINAQNKAQEAIDKNESKFTKYGATNAALVSVDVKTGEILSMIGGKDYFDVSHGGNVNVTDSSRQPGSSFKPIVYATAFKNPRFSPAFTLYDVPTDFNGYKPNNYNGSTNGALSMRTALANSLNIPAVKTLGLVGIPEALKTAKDLGITTLTQPERYGLSLVLGGGEVKPIEMAGAFAAFSDTGVYHQPTSILKVEDHSGKPLYEYKSEENKFQALDPQIAYEITNILSDNGARCMVFGCNGPLNFGDRHVFAKTGTTQEFHDAWTVGGSTQIATAIWVGNNDNTKMKSGADGSIIAAPIFRTYMDNFPATDDWIRPDGIQEITVEKYSSRLPTQYSQKLVKDIFASWQIPTEKDNMNVVIKVNKVNGKLATDSTPPELVEERLFTNLHNEWGDAWKSYMNWEAAVRSWAQANGLNLLPPSENDDSYSSRPSISITSPGADATVKNQITVSSNISSTEGVGNVVYYLNDAQIGSNSSSPYSIDFDTKKYSNGIYKLIAKMTDPNGVGAENSIQITIQNDVAPQINGVSISSVTSNAATVKFNTDVSTDSTIYYGLTTAYGGNITAGSGTTHSAALSGLSGASKYYFKITVGATENQGNFEGSFNTI